MYKRLTKYNQYNHNAEVYAYTVGKEDIYFDGVDIVGNENSSLAQETIDKLALLEDKIENVTLIERPPVKKGDRIWLIRKYWDYFEGRTKKEIVGRVVKRIFLNNDNSLTFSCLVIHKGKKLISIVKSTTFNKTWFLTKAEAEKKLKELKGEV